jgi:hypothetical protein
LISTSNLGAALQRAASLFAQIVSIFRLGWGLRERERERDSHRLSPDSHRAKAQKTAKFWAGEKGEGGERLLLLRKKKELIYTLKEFCGKDAHLSHFLTLPMKSMT